MCSYETGVPRRWDSVIDVMDLIEKESILSPIQVISILSLNPQLPLQIAYNYMSKSLKVGPLVICCNFTDFDSQELTDDISQGEILLRGALEKLNGISHDAQLQQQAKQTKAAKHQEKSQLRRHHHHGYDDDDSDEEQDEEVEEDIKLMEVIVF